MNLRITVEDRTYDVHVELLDGAPENPAGLSSGPPPDAAPMAPQAGNGEAPAREIVRLEPGEVALHIGGTILDVLVQIGESVKEGQSVLAFAASKAISPDTAHFAGNVHAPIAGKVAEILVKKGDSVAANQILMRIKPA